jgi:hypothetical protein
MRRWQSLPWLRGAGVKTKTTRFPGTLRRRIASVHASLSRSPVERFAWEAERILGARSTRDGVLGMKGGCCETVWCGGRNHRIVSLVVSLIGPAWSDSRYERITLRLEDKSSDDKGHYVDVNVGGKAFPRVGDYFVVRADFLYTRGTDEKVGTYSGDCLLTQFDPNAGPVEVECDLTFDLPNGIVTAEGPLNFTEQFGALAITGGTGKYKTAHGQIKFESTDLGTLFDLNILL